MAKSFPKLSPFYLPQVPAPMVLLYIEFICNTENPLCENSIAFSMALSSSGNDLSARLLLP